MLARLCSGYLFRSVSIGLALLGWVGTSEAVTLRSDASYDLTGGFSFYLSTPGQTNAQSYRFAGTFGPGSFVDTGTLSGGVFDNVTLGSTLHYTISKNGQNVGSADADLIVGWNDVKYDSLRGVAVAKEGQSNGGGLLLDLAGILNNQAFSFTSALDQMFMHIPLGTAGGYYDNATGAAGSAAYSMAFGNTGTGHPSGIDGWLASSEDIILNGVAYHLHGDIHGALSGGCQCGAVPEPATMALLSVGLAGAAVRRRKLLA